MKILYDENGSIINASHIEQIYKFERSNKTSGITHFIGASAATGETEYTLFRGTEEERDAKFVKISLLLKD